MSNGKLFIAFSTAFAIACGGGQKNDSTGPEEPVEEQDQSQDFVFELDQVRIEGQLFRPEALPQPPMLRVVPKRTLKLKQARRKYERAKGKKKEQELQILATLLWDESKKLAETDPDKASERRQEARDALRAYREENEGAAGEVTLQMLGAHAIYADDTDEAISIYEELVERFADSKSAVQHQARLGHLYLLAGRNDDAAALVEGWTVGEELAGEAAYTLGWVKFRQRQFDEARTALAHAVANWKGSAQAVESDLLLVTAYGATPTEQASTMLAELAALSKTPAEKAYVLMFQENLAYQQSGQFEKAAQMLAAAAAANEGMPAADKVAFPSLETDYYLRANSPEKVAGAIFAAWEALETCGDACANSAQQQKKTLLDNIQKLGTHFHTIYATALDDQYYDPAKQLYEFYLQDESRDNHGQVRTYLNDLQSTRENADPVRGKHDKEMIATIVGFRKQGLVRCYETVLQTEPELEGDVKITAEIANSGAVTNVTTEPEPGDDGMAAVAACAQDEVGAWSFPGRSLEGTTAVVVPFSFARKAAGDSGPQQPATPAKPDAPAPPDAD